jgi:hypothetical protein
LTTQEFKLFQTESMSEEVTQELPTKSKSWPLVKMLLLLLSSLIDIGIQFSLMKLELLRFRLIISLKTIETNQDADVMLNNQALNGNGIELIITSLLLFLVNISINLESMVEKFPVLDAYIMSTQMSLNLLKVTYTSLVVKKIWKSLMVVHSHSTTLTKKSL